jgi:topoisomerase-4 subunit A
LTPAEGSVARVCIPLEGSDAVALVGDNRRMLVVERAALPVMTRGRGVILQRYKAGRLADAKAFRLADGLSWQQGDPRNGGQAPSVRARTRTETDLAPWRGARGAAGRAVPAGFPRSNKFGA